MTAIGSLIIISAPSGAGKTSLINTLIKKISNLQVSISYTTRPKRNNEINGINYHFVDQEQFFNMVNKNYFLEYAKVFDNYYGTSQEDILQILKLNHDVILEIDWQGAKQIRNKIPNIVSIFILPPSTQDLKNRLTNRNQDNAKVISNRMAKAKNEMSHYNEYDYLIINDDFNEALSSLEAIIIANRLKVSRQKYVHYDLITELCK